MAGVATKMANMAREGLRRYHTAHEAGKESPRKTFRKEGGGTFAAVVKALRGGRRGAVRSILNARTAALKQKAARATEVA